MQKPHFLRLHRFGERHGALAAAAFGERHPQQIRTVADDSPLDRGERARLRDGPIAGRKRPRLEDPDAVRRQHELDALAVAFGDEPPRRERAHVHDGARAVLAGSREKRVGLGRAVGLEDAERRRKALAAERHRALGVESRRTGFLLVEEAVGAADEDEREVAQLILAHETRDELARLQRAEERQRVRERRAAHERGRRGRAVGVADADFAPGHALRGECGGAARLVRENPRVALIPRMDGTGGGNVAVLLHEAALVHHVHARHVAVDSVEGAHPEHLAKRGGREIAGSAGEQLRHAAAPVVQDRLARQVERDPFGRAARLAGGIERGADFVHAGNGLAAQA